MARKRQTPEELSVKREQEKERKIYRIMLQHSNAMPFEFRSFETLEECEECLKNLFYELDLEHKKYYVINKYYKNRYIYIEPIDKYSIEYRNNDEWILYELPENNVAQEETTKNIRDCNINVNWNINIKIIK